MRVTIPRGTVVDGNYAIYDIVVEGIPRESARRVSKRFSDFVELKKQIEKEVNESIPYSLPSKFVIGKSTTESVIESRRPQLENFLNEVLNDNKILGSSTSLFDFLQVPRSSLMDITGSSLAYKTNEIKSEGGKWSSNSKLEDLNSKKWLDVIKDCKSLLQDIRTKMFSKSYNVIDLRKTLDLVEIRIQKLDEYLNNTDEFGTGEMTRRRDMLNQVTRDYHDLKQLNVGLTHNSASSTTSKDALPSSTEANKNKLFGRRTLGKPKETETTRQLDNEELLQYQQQVMKDQDKDIEGLRTLIQRQKQIGITINEELGIQNDLLSGLNDQVDKSSTKLAGAKAKISKIL